MVWNQDKYSDLMEAACPPFFFSVGHTESAESGVPKYANSGGASFMFVTGMEK